MNLERFFTIIEDIHYDLTSAKLAEKLKQLTDSLQALSEDPSNPDREKAVSEHKRMVHATIQGLRDIKETQYVWSVYEAYDLTLLSPQVLNSRFQDCFTGNEITPSITRDNMASLYKEVLKRSNALGSIVGGFDVLGVDTDHLEPEECTIDVKLPRDESTEAPKTLGKEIRDLDLVFSPFGYMCTKNDYEMVVRSIGSSDFLVTLQFYSAVALSGATIVAAITFSVNRILSVYSNVLKLRVQKNELQQMNAPAEIVGQIEKFAEQKVEDAIEKTILELQKEYSILESKDEQNQNAAGLRVSLRRIARAIDNGVDFEPRVGALPPPMQETEEGEVVAGKYTEEQEKYELLRNQILAQTHEFRKFERAGEPILSLPEPDNDNDDQ